MNRHEVPNNESSDSEPNNIVERLRGWLQAQDPDERYLAAAADLAELERRMRLLDRKQ